MACYYEYIHPWKCYNTTSFGLEKDRMNFCEDVDKRTIHTFLFKEFNKELNTFPYFVR